MTEEEGDAIAATTNNEQTEETPTSPPLVAEAATTPTTATNSEEQQLSQQLEQSQISSESQQEPQQQEQQQQEQEQQQQEPPPPPPPPPPASAVDVQSKPHERSRSRAMCLFDMAPPIPVRRVSIDANARDSRCGLRKHVIAEILSTEKTYVGNLRALRGKFSDPDVGPVLNQCCKNVQFSESDVKMLSDVNESLLRDLQRDEGGARVGLCFKTFAPVLKVYSVYINRYEAIAEALWPLRSEPFFSELSSLLIQPVQRIPRYVLLLSALLKHTQPGEEYDMINEALELMKQTAAGVNEKKRDAESISLVANIAERVVGMPYIFSIVAPARRYIAEGVVLFQHLDFCSPDLANPKPMHVVVFNDILIVCQMPRTGERQLQFVEWIELESKHKPVAQEDAVIFGSSCGRLRWRLGLPPPVNSKQKLPPLPPPVYGAAAAAAAAVGGGGGGTPLSRLSSTNLSSIKLVGWNDSAAAIRFLLLLFQTVETATHTPVVNYPHLLQRSVRMGWLAVKRTGGKGSGLDAAKCWCILQNSILYYFTASFGEEEPLGMLPLFGCSVQIVMLKQKRSIKISHSARRDYFLTCIQDHELDCWVETLQLSAAVSEDSVSPAHEFAARSFVTPVECAQCSERMFSGFKCKMCNTLCHKLCLRQFHSSCPDFPRAPMNGCGHDESHNHHHHDHSSTMSLEAAQKIATDILQGHESVELAVAAVDSLVAATSDGSALTPGLASLLVSSGVVSAAIKQLKMSCVDGGNAFLAAACVRVVALLGTEQNVKLAIANEGGLSEIVDALHVEDAVVQEQASAAVWALAYHSGPSRINDLLYQLDAVKALANLLSSPSTNVVLNAMGALATALVAADANKVSLMETDALRIAISNLNSSSVDVQLQSVTLVCNMANAPVPGMSHIFDDLQVEKALKALQKSAKEVKILSAVRVALAKLKGK